MAKLTQKEILTALLEGKKIKQPQWTNGFYIYLKDDIILNQDNWIVPIIEIGKDWEINIKPVSFFEALEAMKDGKKCKPIDRDIILYFGTDNNLNTNKGYSYTVTKSDLVARWIILEGDENE